MTELPGMTDPALPEVLARTIQRYFRRSLQIRNVDAGSCNGCGLEITQLFAPQFDVQSLNIDFVASPRHADALLVSGAVTRNMTPALLASYEAMAAPRMVIAVGTCAVSGGVFGAGYGGHPGGTPGKRGVERFLPVDVYIPGCPPRPEAILHGLLVAIHRAEPRLLGMASAQEGV